MHADVCNTFDVSRRWPNAGAEQAMLPRPPGRHLAWLVVTDESGVARRYYL
jgi:hypothetical protein